VRGRTGLVICLLSGVALSFAFPEPSIAPVAWFCIAPLIYLCRTATPRKGALFAAAFGSGFFGALLIWVSAVGYVPWILLVILETALFCLFGYGTVLIWRLGDRWALVGIPALWVVVEMIRTYFPIFGFPWGQLAQGQVRWPELLYPAGLGGGGVVSFIVVAINVLLVLIRVRDGRARRLPMLATGAVLLWPLLLAAVYHPGLALYNDSPLLFVGVVQGNASPGIDVEDERRRVERHVELTRTLSRENLDLVVWPESSVGIDPFEDSGIAEAVSEAARDAGVPMIVGANLDQDDDHYLVTTLLVSPEGEFIDRYQKTHLVPFGEYVPGRSFLGWLPMLDQVPRDAVAGDQIKVFDVNGTKVATVISFEGDFGPLVRSRIAAGGRVLVVATNTSTWGRSWASAQHVAMSQVRAAENGVAVVHAALSGISAAIDETGRVITNTSVYTEDTLLHEASSDDAVTIYARTGEWFPWSCAVISALVLIFGSRRRSTVPA
jgi:apolipoprotein N-acyltransferase